MSLVSGNQLRAGRALAGVDQKWLADRSGVSINTIRNMEARGAEAITSGAVTLRKVQAALEAVGIEFTNGDMPGLRMKSDATSGVIYDDKKPVAVIRNGEVFSDTTGRKIAVVRAGELFDAHTGQRLGSLALLGGEGTPLPSEFRKLLT
jgi:transcriptional regulator with XRE-family HTH domain